MYATPPTLHQIPSKPLRDRLFRPRSLPRPRTSANESAFLNPFELPFQALKFARRDRSRWEVDQELFPGRL